MSNPDLSKPVEYDRNEQPITTPDNRGNEIRFEEGDLPGLTVKLTQIDTILQNYFQNTIQPTIMDNGTAVHVPVIFSNAERWAAVKKHGVYRDPRNDKLQPPLIFIKKNSIAPAPNDNPNNKYVYYSWGSRWNKRNIYDRFAALNNVTPSQELHQVIVPDYIEIDYQIILWAEYQTQINDLIEQINVENHEFWGPKNNFKFRVKISEYSDDSELPPSNDRLIRVTFGMTVSAYLIPDKMVKNWQPASTSKKVYTPKKTVIVFETELSGSMPV